MEGSHAQCSLLCRAVPHLFPPSPPLVPVGGGVYRCSQVCLSLFTEKWKFKPKNENLLFFNLIFFLLCVSKTSVLREVKVVKATSVIKQIYVGCVRTMWLLCHGNRCGEVFV